MSAAADARRATRAANALHQLVAAMREGGDVTLSADNAAKVLAKYNGRPHLPSEREGLVALGEEELLALAGRLETYAKVALVNPVPR